MSSDPTLVTHAEAAFSLVSSVSVGTLSTLDPDGFPHGSYVVFALDVGDPVLLISQLATHTQHIVGDPRASLMVHESRFDDPLANARVTLVGNMARVDDTSVVKPRFLAAHPAAEQYVDFRDFGFYKLVVRSVRYIGGFGRMSWVRLDEWRDTSLRSSVSQRPGLSSHTSRVLAVADIEHRTYLRADARVVDIGQHEVLERGHIVGRKITKRIRRFGIASRMRCIRGVGQRITTRRCCLDLGGQCTLETRAYALEPALACGRKVSPMIDEQITERFTEAERIPFGATRKHRFEAIAIKRAIVSDRSFALCLAGIGRPRDT